MTKLEEIEIRYTRVRNEIDIDSSELDEILTQMKQEEIKKLS